MQFNHTKDLQTPYGEELVKSVHGSREGYGGKDLRKGAGGVSHKGHPQKQCKNQLPLPLVRFCPHWAMPSLPVRANVLYG